MGRCYKCGQPVPGDVQMQLCSRCQQELARKKAEGLNKVIYAPVRHYCPGCGKLMSESQSGRITVSPNEKKESDGFYHKFDTYCSDCSVRKVKKGGKFLKFFLIIIIIGALVYGGSLLFNKSVLGTSSVVEKNFERNLEKAESSPDLIKDVRDDSAPGVTIAGYISDYFDKDDYHLYLYTDNGKLEVQKHTSIGSAEYYFKFDKGYGEMLGGKMFGGKMFVVDDDYLYEVGDDKIAYSLSSDKYSEIRSMLQEYLPENICLKESFNSQSTLKQNGEYTVDILYGGNAIVYMDWNKSKYYEKKSDSFIYMIFSEQGKGSLVMTKPKLSDCEVIS